MTRNYTKRSVEGRFSGYCSAKDDKGCILWTGCLNPDGYGVFGIAGRVHLAHRVAWALVNGPVPAGLVVSHYCKVRACVNVEHLFLNTLAAASSRAVSANGRKETCPYGHPYDYINPYTRGRECLQCRRVANRDACRRWRQRRKAEVNP